MDLSRLGCTTAWLGSEEGNPRCTCRYAIDIMGIFTSWNHIYIIPKISRGVEKSCRTAAVGTRQENWLVVVI